MAGQILAGGGTVGAGLRFRRDLDDWMKEQGDTKTVFGKPLLHNEPVTLITPGAKK